MDNLIGEVVYNKFLTEKVEIKIKDVIIERLLSGCEIFIKYMREELKHTINPYLKDDIEKMNRVVEELRQLGDDAESEGSIVITISEFLILKYGLERVAKLVGALDLSDTLSIKYMDCIIYLEELYGTLNKNDINLYYSFLATFDDTQEGGLN